MKPVLFTAIMVSIVACPGIVSAQDGTGDWIELYLKSVDRKYLEYTLTTTCADEDFAAIVVQADRIAEAATAAGTARELQKLAEANAAKAELSGNRDHLRDATNDMDEADERLNRAVTNLENAMIGLPECKPGYPFVYRSLAESMLRDLIAKVQSTGGIRQPGTAFDPDAPPPGLRPYPADDAPPRDR
jgi:hypothetical protein